jgi:hypothetical protein
LAITDKTKLIKENGYKVFEGRGSIEVPGVKEKLLEEQNERKKQILKRIHQDKYKKCVWF